jgi:hypothetical protein
MSLEPSEREVFIDLVRLALRQLNDRAQLQTSALCSLLPPTGARLTADGCATHRSRGPTSQRYASGYASWRRSGAGSGTGGSVVAPAFMRGVKSIYAAGTGR